MSDNSWQLCELRYDRLIRQVSEVVIVRKKQEMGAVVSEDLRRIIYFRKECNDLSESLSEALKMVDDILDIIQDKTTNVGTKNSHMLAMHVKLEEKMKQFKTKRYIDEDIVCEIEMKLSELVNITGDSNIRRQLTLEIRRNLVDVGLLLDYFQDLAVTIHEDISVLTLLDEPRFSAFLTKADKKELIQKRASAKCEDNFNIDNIFKESKLGLSTLEDGEYTIQSDVFQTKHLHLSKNAFYRVELFTCERFASEEWVAISRIGGKWVELPALTKKQHAYFNAKDIDTVYIISRPKCTRFTLTRKGWTFQSDEDHNIKVEFPPDAVEDDTPISLKVLTEKVGYIKGSEEVDEFEVYDISPCITFDHKGVEKLKKNVKVVLPLPETSVHLDTFVVLLEWTRDDEIELRGHNIQIRDGVGIVEVDSFSRYILARVKKGQAQNFPSCQVKKQVSNRLGVMIDCQYLIFVDTSENNTFWVEVVSSNKVEDLLNRRKKDNPGLSEMTNSRSCEISLADGQGVRIDIKGNLRFIPGYIDGCAVLNFRRKSVDNHIRFPLEPNPQRSEDKFTYMNFIKDTEERPFYIYHFSAIECYTQRHAKTEIDTKPVPYSSTRTGFFSDRSLMVLAAHIPIAEIQRFGIHLGLSGNYINNLQAKRYEGFDLTFQILMGWMQLYRERDDLENITNLKKVLDELKLIDVLQIVEKVFHGKRELQGSDFS